MPAQQIDDVMGTFPRLLPDFDIIASDDGFVVHDANRDVVHYLNQTAAIVLSLCDGRRSAEQIAHLLSNQFGLSESPSEDVVAIINQFKNEGLVQ